MKAVDTRGKFDDIFGDKYLNILPDRLNNICKMQAGDKTCRYIVLGNSGFVCIKNTNFKEAIDRMIDEGKMIAKGDNCSGLVQGMPSNANKKENSDKKKDSEKSSLKKSEKEDKEESAEEKCEEGQQRKKTPYRIKAIRSNIQGGKSGSNR